MPGLLDFLGSNAGSIVGGLLGAAGSGDSKTGATQNRDPWGPAQPYILKNLENESKLQDYYQKTPFNQQQTQGYSNLFGDIANFRDNVAPGLMDFANKGMTTSYQRQQGGAPGSVGYGGQGGNTQSGQGPFSIARGAQVQNPLLDLNKSQNPYSNGAIAPQQTVQAPQQNAMPQQNPMLGAYTFGHAPAEKNAWDMSSDQEKADYYTANPTMAKITQLLQEGFSMTDISKLQDRMDPGFSDRQRAIASGYLGPMSLGWDGSTPTSTGGITSLSDGQTSLSDSDSSGYAARQAGYQFY